MGLPFLYTTIVLTTLGEEVPETAGSDRVVMYLLSPASGRGGGRVFSRGRCNEHGQLMDLCRVRFPRSLHFLDQCGSGVCGGGTRGGAG